jgi:hypothetical protein
MIKLLQALWRARFGGTATLFAISVPVVAVLACGAVDLSSVITDRQKMQDVADAAALAGARELTVANVQGVTDRAQAFANEQLTDVATRVKFTTVATIPQDNSSITVRMLGHRASFFGNLLPAGGWHFDVHATAGPVERMPLCVLGSGGDIALGDSSRISANSCLVHSNANLNVPAPASLDAGAAEAVGSAAGSISPAPQTGAPPIPDPFAGLNLKIPPSCNILDLLYDLGVNILTPGIHCGAITVRKNSTVILLPGEHYFMRGALTLMENSTLNGSNVVLIFDNQSNFAFMDHSSINLKGRTSGPFSGFVIATTPSNTNTFTISSDAAHTLEGTVYIPNAPLVVSGSAINVADQSNWTVIVAKGLQLSGSPNLVVNANYAASPVKTPPGVGAGRGAKLLN